MRRSSADLPVRHTKSFDFLCTKTAREHLLLASGFLRSPAILVNVIFVALGGDGDFPRAGNDHGKLGRGIVSGAGTLQLLDQLVQPLRNKAASKANNHAVREAACACIAELMCKASRICPSGLAGGAVLDDGGAWHQSCPSCFPSTAPLVALAAGGQAGRCAVRAPLAAGSGDVLQGRQLAGKLNKPSGSGCTCHCAPPAAMPSTLLHLPLSCP